MQGIIRTLRRFWLNHQIKALRTQILLCQQRRQDAYITIESTEAFQLEAQRKIHRIKSDLLLLDRPRVRWSA